MIIGIVGKAGSGKDTLASMIPGVKRFSFADPLKEFCARVFDWDRETLWGDSSLRNKPDPRYTRPDGTPLTPRHALQTLGTEWGRECCPDIWALNGVRRAQEWLADATSKPPFIQGPAVALFTDCRFVNEAKIIRAAGGHVWRIVRPGAGLTSAAGLHPSEVEQESKEMLELVTRTIFNNGPLELLKARADLAFKSLFAEQVESDSAEIP